MTDFRDMMLRHAVHVEGLKIGEGKKLLKFYERSLLRVTSKAANTNWQAMRRAKQGEFLSGVVKSLSDPRFTDRAMKSSLDLAKYEAEFLGKSVSQIAGDRDFEMHLPAPNQIDTAARTSLMTMRGPAGGRVLRGFFRGEFLKNAKLIADEMRLGYAMGEPTAAIVARVRKQHPLARRNLMTIVRTGMTHAAASSRGLFAAQNQSIIGAERWVSTLDSRTSPYCRALDGRKFEVGKGPRPPAHPNCLPGDTLVLPGGGISAAFSRKYEGDLIVIRTASGRVLRCTPNHPVLCNGRWIPAKDVYPGCKVVRDLRREWEPSGIGDQRFNGPTPIHQVAESLRCSGGVTTAEVPASAPYFHGDGEGGVVDVVFANRLLLHPVNAALAQAIDDVLLECRHMGESFLSGLGSFLQVGQSPLATPDGIVGGLDLGGTSLAGHSTPLGGLSLGSSAQIDSLLQQDALDWAGADSELAANLYNAETGLVELDDVISVDSCDFSGHVFNLETSDNWYSGNGIITHNCRSTVIPVLKGKLAELDKGGMRRDNVSGKMVSADDSYYDWLKRQPKAFQNQALGPGRGRLFRKKGMTVEKFRALELDRKFRPRSLAEIRKLEKTTLTGKPLPKPKPAPPKPAPYAPSSTALLDDVSKVNSWDHVEQLMASAKWEASTRALVLKHKNAGLSVSEFKTQGMWNILVSAAAKKLKLKPKAKPKPKAAPKPKPAPPASSHPGLKENSPTALRANSMDIDEAEFNHKRRPDFVSHFDFESGHGVPEYVMDSFDFNPMLRELSASDFARLSKMPKAEKERLLGMYAKWDDDLDAAAKPLSEDMRVFRGQERKFRPGANLKEGDFMPDSQSWHSTTTNTRVSEGFADGDGDVLDIVVRKGTRAVVTNDEEMEIILHRATKFRVVKIDEFDGRLGMKSGKTIWDDTDVAAHGRRRFVLEAIQPGDPGYPPR